MDFQKITFLLGGPFPTPKAYGVTTRETINVLLKDSIDVEIYCYKSTYNDPDFDSIIEHIEHFQSSYITKHLRRIALFGSSKFNSILFRLVSLIDFMRSIRQIKKASSDVFWTREPLYAFLCLIFFKNTRIILEVHEFSNLLLFKVLKVYLNRITFCPINECNLKFLKSIYRKSFNFIISPMGISRNSIASRVEVEDFVKKIRSQKYNQIKIGYAGKLRPTTYSKGIEDLIFLAKLLQDNHSCMEVNLLGATKEEFRYFEQLITKNSIEECYLQVKEHVPHSLALSLLKNFDVLVLPVYSNSKYIGMPLKLIEYLAAGRIVIFGDSQLYRDMVPESLRVFSYTPQDIDDLYKSILRAINYEKLFDLIIEGIEFAEKFTWERRTRNIIWSSK